MNCPATDPRQKTDAFEAKALGAMGLDTQDVPPRYRSSYFLHIWSNGYAAGYYAYLWTEMLDDDSYDWFVHHGDCRGQAGQRFRDLILSRGHTLDYGRCSEPFTARSPDIGPMLAIAAWPTNRERWLTCSRLRRYGWDRAALSRSRGQEVVITAAFVPG